MKSWENKLSSIEQRINIEGKKQKVCVIFQDGQTIPENTDPEDAQLIVEIGGIDSEDI